MRQIPNRAEGQPNRWFAEPVRAAAIQRRPANFAEWTPRPNPQSQSFSRSYGSILPTSLTYIVLSTRGYSPWRPDAVMSTTEGVNKSLLWIFKDRQERTGHCKDYNALPIIEPYRRANRFQGKKLLKRKENSSRGSCRCLQIHLCYHTISTSRFRNINLIPFR